MSDTVTVTMTRMVCNACGQEVTGIQADEAAGVWRLSPCGHEAAILRFERTDAG